MTAEEIIEGNKLIAIFMDGKIVIEKELEFINFPNEQKTPMALKFHSSWDWQMPVWAKLYDITSPSPTIIEPFLLRVEKLRKAILKNDVLLGFSELIEAIKWYNKNVKDK